MDNGLLTKQLVKKAFLMMKDRVFGHGTTTSMVGSPVSSKVAKLKEEKAKEKGKGKGGFKRTGKAHFGEEQTQDLEWWSEEDSVWWSKGKKGKKVSSKGKNNLPDSEFRTYHPEKGTDIE